MPTTKNGAKKLQKEFENLVTEAKEMMESVGDKADTKTKEALAGLSESLESARNKFEELQGKTEEGIRKGGKVIGEYPYQAVGVSLAFGVLLGMLCNWRKPRC